MPASQDQAVVNAIRRVVPAVQAVYRFGSSVTGGTHAASDLDVAFLAPAPLDPTVRFDLEQSLASAVRRDVDLVDLRAASSVMAMQVVSTGMLIDDVDAASRGAFEDYVYGAYARLNEERREILRRIADEGTVYGR